MMGVQLEETPCRYRLFSQIGRQLLKQVRMYPLLCRHVLPWRELSWTEAVLLILMVVSFIIPGENFWSYFILSEE
jgi:hypothetical protein